MHITHIPNSKNLCHAFLRAKIVDPDGMSESLNGSLLT